MSKVWRGTAPTAGIEGEANRGTSLRSGGKRVKNRHEDKTEVKGVGGMAEKGNTMMNWRGKRKRRKKSQTPQEICLQKFYRGRSKKNGYPSTKGGGVRMKRQKIVIKKRKH